MPLIYNNVIYNNVSRATEDVDVGVFNADFYMRVYVHLKFLKHEGYELTYHSPEDGDVLGGMLTITHEEIYPVEIVNLCPQPMYVGMPHAGRLSVRDPMIFDLNGHELRVCDVEHMILLKMLADGPQDRDDVKLLIKNNDIDILELESLFEDAKMSVHFVRLQQLMAV